MNAINERLRGYTPTAEDRIVDGFGKGNANLIINGAQKYAQEQESGNWPNKRMESLIRRISDSQVGASSVMEGLLEQIQAQRQTAQKQPDVPVKPVREDPVRPESPGPKIQ